MAVTILMICKGAPESLLHDLVTGTRHSSMPPSARHQYATAGLRVLAVASDVRSDQPTSAEDAERELHLLGLIMDLQRRQRRARSQPSNRQELPHSDHR